MHLAVNLSDLLISLWHMMIDCAVGDNRNTWDWAILQDEQTWKTHGKAVEDAGPFLPGSFDHRPQNITEKLNMSYKTWEFQLYMFGVAPALLYGILPDQYWSNYCKLVCGFHILCQHQITFDDLKHAYILFCKWELEFKQLYYQGCEAHLHFVCPCVHQVLCLITETLQKGPPVCYAQWTMEQTIGNIGQEICQPSNPYANFAQEGVHHCQVNALLQ
ncbi:hypothetical protein M404DRAFT_148484 [Pisolithus tinctorius Marx 270]|uniref:Uncharacterized protein n=1 Tax=Pisolithus tinctorius Marx 270 TaxID=870435 RepID=A0A0C3NMV0_PISTI|nr:hypothetical protein M404DRAFT_148484 [Pisolithus tinctorius Marx 270]